MISYYVSLIYPISVVNIKDKLEDQKEDNAKQY